MGLVLTVRLIVLVRFPDRLSVRRIFSCFFKSKSLSGQQRPALSEGFQEKRLFLAKSFTNINFLRVKFNSRIATYQIA